jgi:putative NADH-flavin reductase
MKLAIFGANGPVGRLLTQRALDEGHEVTAVTRHPEAFPIPAGDRLRVQGGDILDAGDVEKAVAGTDAVLTMVGVPYTFKPVTVYSEGIRNVIRAMRATGVRRVVAVTSGGTNPRLDLREGVFFSLVLKPIFGRTLYADMRALEEILSATDLDWTIVRPARLVDTPAVTDYRLAAEAYVVKGLQKTSRLDLAAFLLDQASSDEYLRKGVAIATKT